MTLQVITVLKVEKDCVHPQDIDLVLAFMKVVGFEVYDPAAKISPRVLEAIRCAGSESPARTTIAPAGQPTVYESNNYYWIFYNRNVSAFNMLKPVTSRFGDRQRFVDITEVLLALSLKSAMNGPDSILSILPFQLSLFGRYYLKNLVAEFKKHPRPCSIIDLVCRGGGYTPLWDRQSKPAIYLGVDMEEHTFCVSFPEKERRRLQDPSLALPAVPLSVAHADPRRLEAR